MAPADTKPPATVSAATKDGGIVVGTAVDFYSKSVNCWLPALITEIDGESGAIKVNLKPSRPYSVQEQTTSIRPRTKPSREKLEWVRNMLRDGTLEDESNKVFDQHATGNPFVLKEDAVPALAATVDQTFGVSGSIIAIKRVFTDGDPLQGQRERAYVTRETFLDQFWDLAWGVQKTYGNSLSHENRVQRRREEPECFYDFLKNVGSGTFGEVYHARCKRTGCERAIKIIEKDDSWKMDEMDPEIVHLKKLDHPHIVRMYEFFDWGKNVYLVIDWCSGGDLDSAIAKSKPHGLEDDFVADVMRQTLMAIAHVHARGVVHLDLKPANIMLMPNKGTLPPCKQAAKGHTLAPCNGSVGHVMVIDLGVAQIFRPGNYNDYNPMGTPMTMAPEVWWGSITPKADIFSLGVVMFQAFTTRFPFNVSSSTHEARNYWSKAPRPDHWSRIISVRPDEVVLLLANMLALAREDRPTASDCLKRPFINGKSLSFSNYDIECVPGSGEESIMVPAHLLERIRQGPSRSVLHRSVALAIARRWPSNHNPTVKKLFQSLDPLCEGSLRKSTLIKTLHLHGLSEHEAMEAADCMDLCRDGAVEWTEFVAACIDLSDENMDDDLRNFFKAADRDDDGLLGFDDLHQLLVSDADATFIVQDVLLDVAGRVEKGAKIDWSTFRKQFRSKSAGSFADIPAVTFPTREGGYNGTRAPPVEEFGWMAQAQAQARVLFEQLQEVFVEPPKQLQDQQPKPKPVLDPTQLQDNLRRLKEMGLDNKEQNIAALRRHNNKLSDRVISEILQS